MGGRTGRLDPGPLVRRDGRCAPRARRDADDPLRAGGGERRGGGPVDRARHADPHRRHAPRLLPSVRRPAVRALRRARRLGHDAALAALDPHDARRAAVHGRDRDRPARPVHVRPRRDRDAVLRRTARRRRAARVPLQRDGLLLDRRRPPADGAAVVGARGRVPPAGRRLARDARPPLPRLGLAAPRSRVARPARRLQVAPRAADGGGPAPRAAADEGGRRVTADPVRAIADAVLYEGYILWPYRRSALKNQRRWTFGGVYPRGHSAAHPDDPWTMRTECLLEGGTDATVDVRVRFLHVVTRRVGRAAGDGLELVDELQIGGERYVAWDEAAEREVVLAPAAVGSVAVCGRRAAIESAAGSDREALRHPDGPRAGALIRSWHGLEGAVEVAAERLAAALWRVSVTIANTTPWAGDDREAALGGTFCSTHTVMRADRGGAFVSLTDPPAALRRAVDGCDNAGTWPVLVGEPGARDTLLSSPIILEDHPRIAPESPGDLFDGGEIDQMLVLNILSLTDEEKAEMRATDPRAREILERTEALTPDELMRLHGTIRDWQVLR